MKRKRILIIEDNATNSELMAYLMISFGHEPVLAADGEQGLLLARQASPDLIICDIQLPGIDGYDVARALKADPTTAALPLVAVTANAMLGDRERVLEAGFDAYLAKPVEPEQIMQFLDGLLQQNRSRQSASPGRGQRILVVDDHAVNLDLKRSILQPHGYTVLTASSVAEALRLLEQQPPHLIISDINMGAEQAGGFDLLQLVRSDVRFADLPFIMITSTFPDSTTRRRALAMGATRFVERPVAPEQVLAEVAACLDSKE